MVDLKTNIPKKFFEPEIRNDYEISKEMKEVWAVEIDLLCELLRVCKKHNLKIFASGGTMLGAARHQGFIPWDDDIDMRMLREDYEKLCSVASEEFKYPYFFQTAYTDSGCLTGHAQLRNSKTTGILKHELEGNLKHNQGIFVDIFVLDTVPNDLTLRKQQKDKVERLRNKFLKISKLGSRNGNRSNSNLKTKCRNLIHSVFGGMIEDNELKIYKKFEKECQKYSGTTNLVGTISFPGPYSISKLEDYEDPLYLPFEFMEMPVSKNYDKILTDMFGDYHKFVKGTSAHGDVIFNTSIPYDEYLKEKVGQ